jgi:hypothetical protein
MRQAVSRTLLGILLISLPLATACSGDGEGGHDVNKGGVMHKAGLEDPLHNCVECHGADLKGGSGPSCYSCHSLPASHTAVRGGIPHNPATDTAVCNACHGPNNSGGLGPACSKCHA